MPTCGRCVSPTSTEHATSLVDTSAAVPLLLSDHEHHRTTFAALADRTLGLSGHAAFETYSVLTRLPPPSRLVPRAVGRLLSANFPDNRFLSPEGTAGLLGSLSSLGIAGGAVYDALVGAAAAEHRLVLTTRDRRAAETYRLLGVEVELLA